MLNFLLNKHLSGNPEKVLILKSFFDYFAIKETTTANKATASIKAAAISIAV